MVEKIYYSYKQKSNIMSTLINSIVGIQAMQAELGKCSTEEEQMEVMEKIYSKSIASSRFNVLCFLVAIVSVVIIRCVLS